MTLTSNKNSKMQKMAGYSFWSAFFSWLFSMLLLLGIPGVFCFFLLNHLERGFREEVRLQQERDIREVLEQVSIRGNLQRRFQSLFDRLAQLPWTPQRFAPRLKKILDSQKNAVDAYLFTSDGKRITVPGSPDNLVFASQQFLKAVMNPDDPISEKLIRAFAGNANVPLLMARSPGTLVDLVNGDQNTFGGWWTLRDKSGKLTGHLLVFVHRKGVTPEDLLDQAVRETNQQVKGRFTCGWLDPQLREILRPVDHVFSSGLSAQLVSLRPGQTFIEWPGKLLVAHSTEAGEILFGLASTSTTAGNQFSVWRWRLSLFLAGGLLLASWGHFSLRKLRAKLIWQLAIAGGFPLIVFLSMVFIDRQNREYILEQELCDSHLEFLSKIDADYHSRFLPALQMYESVFQRIRADPARLIDQVAQEIRDLIARLNGLITRLVIVDRSGKILFFGIHETGNQIRKEGVESLPHGALSIIQNVNQEPPTSSTAGLNNPIMSMLVQTKYAPQWIDEEGLLKSNNVGKDSVLTCFRLFPEKIASYGAVLFATHDGKKGQIQYLRSKLGKPVPLNRRNRPQIWALPIVPGAWPAFPENAPVKSSPSKGVGEKITSREEPIDRNPLIRKMKDLVLSTGLPQHERLWLQNRMMLVSAMKGSFLDGYVLAMARPESTIQGPSRTILYRAIGASLLMMLLTCITGVLTSRMLLKPLSDLGVGLEALKNRDFDVRVLPGQIRELALVADRFNLILENLRDLKMARSVQETLWPSEGLKGVGWQVEGRCVTAAALGGDSYDWFLLPDGRLVVGVGDVAGHGIPSALVAAAAKVELVMNTEFEDDPAVILALINEAFLKQVGKKRPMTFWVGLYNPVTRNLHYANAGHNFPIAVLRDSSPIMLEGKGYPLGSRKKTSYVSGNLDMSHGGRLYIYSDGLVEAINSSSEPFDYGRLEAKILRTMELEVPNAIEVIFSEVQKWSGTSVPDDDQTLVILEVGRSDE